MEDKFRKHIDSLFAETIPTKKSVELKEEMIQNLHDKYDDLIAEGKTEEAAYNIAVAGIGDVSDLLTELEAETAPELFAHDLLDMEKARRKSAMLTAIAVMLYIVSFLPFFILETTSSGYSEILGLPIGLLIVAAATGLIIYNNMTKPKFLNRRDTIVEEFREWQSDEKDRKTLRKAISSALWSIILVLYFVISFATYAWHITWIIFIIGAVAESLINVFFTIKKR